MVRPIFEIKKNDNYKNAILYTSNRTNVPRRFEYLLQMFKYTCKSVRMSVSFFSLLDFISFDLAFVANVIIRFAFRCSDFFSTSFFLLRYYSFSTFIHLHMQNRRIHKAHIARTHVQ